MKSWVTSLSRWSVGAHHNPATPLIPLYLSSTLIQHNTSPKRLSISRPLPSCPTLCISSCYLLFAMLNHGFRATAVGEQAEMGEKWRAHL